MASTLTTSSSSQIILVNGAQSKNIFWVVGSSANWSSIRLPLSQQESSV